MTPDIINGLFEVVGGILYWMNVRRLYADKQIAGVHWYVQGFFSAWGLWNLFYYPNLSQWFSLIGGIVLVSGNLTWTIMARHYSRRPVVST